MQINRLFEIVYILMNKKTTTAKELCDHFEVSQRTVYRDIETLCQAGIPIYTTKGKGGGIGLMENFVLNKSILTDQEQNDILSALQGLKATSFDSTDQVLSKLSSLFGNKSADWIEVDFSNWNSSEEDKKKFYQLKDSILNHKVIEFDYYSSYGQQSHRYAEPMKLLFKGQAWYLLGFCREKKENRYFKISRMKGLCMSNDTFQPCPMEIVKEAETNRVQYAKKDVVFKIDHEMAFRIFDEFPNDVIERSTDGSYLIRTKLQTGAWMTGYLMSYEDHLEVIEPVELRDKLIGIYKNALKKYKYDI